MVCWQLLGFNAHLAIRAANCVPPWLVSLAAVRHISNSRLSSLKRSLRRSERRKERPASSAERAKYRLRRRGGASEGGVAAQE